MALPFIFQNLSGNVPAADLDANFNAIGNMGVYQCGATGTNTIALTLSANQPTLVAYANRLSFGFTAAASSTNLVTANVASIGALNVYNQDGSQCGENDIISGIYYELVYLTSLNSGAGGFQKIQFQNGFKVGSFTYDVSTASGTQAITGAGFRPKSLVLAGSINSSVNAFIGFSDGSSNASITQATTSNWFSGASIASFIQVGNTATAVVSSFDADGFTLSWTKTLTPTGIANMNYLAFR